MNDASRSLRPNRRPRRRRFGVGVAALLPIIYPSYGSIAGTVSNGLPPTLRESGSPAFLAAFSYQGGGAFGGAADASRSSGNRAEATGGGGEGEGEGDAYRKRLLRRELFSIAPMMGHTNRHYRHFIRLLGSRHAHLYTEMVPASQIVRAYRRARDVYLGTGGGGSSPTNKGVRPEEILELLVRMREEPWKEYQKQEWEHVRTISDRTLSDLLGHACVDPGGCAKDVVGNVALQLGGNDPRALADAAAIGAAFGYDSVNLNCGCPSNAVGGRSGGALLMREPDLVANCVEGMNRATTLMGTLDEGVAQVDVTVKHRLGVRDAATFDAKADQKKR